MNAFADQATTIAAAVPPGMLAEHRAATEHGPHYLSYLPQNLDPALAPIVFVHGYSRNVFEQMQLLSSLGDTCGRAIIAPCFAADRHPRYQRLGRGSDGLRADKYFEQCLDDAERRLAVATNRVILLGYSGGAQFCHRYAMAHPERVENLVAVAAGWYTFPNPDLAFPHGLTTARRLRRVTFDPAAFLAVPMTVLVGSEDRDSVNLRRDKRLDAQQGTNRVERARHWVLAMRMAARLYRVDASISYQEIPGVDHDFETFIARGHLRELILAAIEEQGRSTATARSEASADAP